MEADTLMKVVRPSPAPAPAVATARASIVLPVPGGPNSSTPCGVERGRQRGGGGEAGGGGLASALRLPCVQQAPPPPARRPRLQGAQAGDAQAEDLSHQQRHAHTHSP